MSLKFCSLASGSSGNCYLIKNDSAALIIDAGISGKKILQGLDDTNTPHEYAKGLLITHEHTDHVKSVSVLSKKLPVCQSMQTKEHGEASKNLWLPLSREFFAPEKIFT